MQISPSTSGMTNGIVLPSHLKGTPKRTSTRSTSWRLRKDSTHQCPCEPEKTFTDAMPIVFSPSASLVTRCDGPMSYSPEKQRRREKESPRGVVKVPTRRGMNRTIRNKDGGTIVAATNGGTPPEHGPTLALRVLRGGMRKSDQMTLGLSGIRGDKSFPHHCCC